MQKRKRSNVVAFTLVGAASMVSGCSGPPEEDVSRQLFGEPKDVLAFANVAECTSSGLVDQKTCVDAERSASNDAIGSAPKYANLQDCEDQFGERLCMKDQSGRNGIQYLPVMTGFLIARSLGSSGAVETKYAPLYKDEQDDTYYSGSGAWLHGRSGHGYKIGAKGLDPSTPPKFVASNEVMSRGGFGTRAGRFGGGWGG